MSGQIHRLGLWTTASGRVQISNPMVCAGRIREVKGGVRVVLNGESLPFTSEQGDLGRYLRTTCGIDDTSCVAIPIFCDWDFVVAALLEIAIESARIGARIELVSGVPSILRMGLSGVSMATGVTSRGPKSNLASLRRAILSEVPDAEVETHVIKSRRNPRQLWRIHRPGLTRAELRELSVRGLPVGRAILQFPPTPNMSIAEDEVWPRRWVEESIQAFLSTYEGTSKLLQASAATHLFAYNGRFLLERAVVLAGTESGSSVFCYDNAGSDCDFEIQRETIHDWSRLQKRIKQISSRLENESECVYAKSWFESRRNHTDPEVQRFVSHQELGKGIEIGRSKKAIVYFSSSIDEVAELEFDWKKYFDSQENALRVLATECQARDDVCLVVRSHPNMLTKSEADQFAWQACVESVAPDFHFAPDSTVDSYELMSQAYAVVTYGSTIGIEAAFEGKRSIVMGPSIYDELGVVARVETPQELSEALDRDVTINRDYLLAYGLMMRLRGFRLSNISKQKGEYELAGMKIGWRCGGIIAQIAQILRGLERDRLTK